MRRTLVIMLAICVLSSGLFSSAASGENFFEDVSPNAWYAESVQYMQDHGLMNGVGDNRFDPDGTVTRGMLVTILYRLENTDEETGSVSFDDVSAGSYYAKPIAWAANHGIVSGYSQSRFGPNDNVTREQLATILYRYSTFKGYDVTKESTLSSYTDSGAISSYALRAMRWAEAAGIINGVGNAQLGSGLTASRAQVATMVMRFDRTIPSGAATSRNTAETPVSSSTAQSTTSNQGSSSSTEDKQSFALSVDRVTAKAGDKDITVTVSVKSNPGILGMTLSVRYDDAALSLKRVENGEAVSGALTLTNPGKFQSQCRFVWDGIEIAPKDVKNGAILKLHFEIPENAPAGNYPIEFFYNNGDIVDNELSALSPAIQNGSITIAK